MTTICKFPLDNTGYQEIKIPKLYSILSLQVQNDVPTLWVLVYDTDSEKENLSIMIYETGQPIENKKVTQKNFLGTYQINGLEFHAFEVY